MKMTFGGLWDRLSVKNKQLLFFAGILGGVIALTALLIYAGNRNAREFRESLDSYFAIHRLQRELEASRSFAETYFRDFSDAALREYSESTTRLWTHFSRVEREADTSLNAYFQVNATFYGLQAYVQRVSRALHMAEQGDPNYYRVFTDAVRISRFVDQYLTQLFEIRLNEGIVDYEEHIRTFYHLRLAALGGVVVIGLLLAAFAAVFSRTITTPILRLASEAQRMADGDLTGRPVYVSSTDEIGTLAHSFDQMRSNINAMVEDLNANRDLEKRLHREETKNLRMERSLHEAQLLGLQSQINPHFLFNTLNTIARISTLEGSNTTTSLIHALARVFRYMLRKPSATVPLREELTIVEEYMRIQQYRFDTRLAFSLECNIDPDQVMVPILLLQPLVENAVKHGVEPMEDGGSVRIRVAREGPGRVRMEVTDTGPGMTPAEVENLGKAEGVGLNNVFHRLQLVYHGREHFLVESNPGEGTTVTISIPDRAEETIGVPTADSR